MINCEVFLTLTRSPNYVLTNRTYREAVGGNNSVVGINHLTNATFRITNTKLYVPVVTLSTEDDNNLLQQLKIEFQRTIK